MLQADGLETSIVYAEGSLFQVQSYLPFSIINYGISNNYAGSKVFRQAWCMPSAWGKLGACRELKV